MADLKEVTKVSEITEEHIADYLNLEEPTPNELSELKTYLNVALEFIKKYTGQEELDKYPDFIIVVYVLCQDMKDNKKLYVEKGSISKVVETILDMHSVNLV